MTSVSDYLHIFIDGEEKAGLFVYWLSPDQGSDRMVQWRPSVAGTVFVARPWSHRGAVIGMITIELDSKQWDLRELIDMFQDLLSSAIQRGATVAWLGGEDCSWNPEVLKPENEGGNVLALYAVEVGFVHAITAVDEVVFVNDRMLRDTWRVVEPIMDDSSELME